MKIHLFLIASAALSLTLSANAETLVLDGVNVLGGSRSAYISRDGQRLRVREQERVGDWRVEAIEARAVQLRNLRNGQLQILELHAAMAVEEAPPSLQEPEASGVPSDDGGAPALIDPSEKEELEPGKYRITPKYIDDSDVPEGYVKRRSLFGDILIKESVLKEGEAR